ncbi:putative mitochondrial protein [Tanacetum coccineum]
MTQVPVLALPDFLKRFTVETYASGHGVEAVLMQEGKPIMYFSQVLGPRAQMKSVYERELMAIVMAVQKWRSLGKENGVADALLRRGDDTDLGTLLIASTGLCDDQRQAVNTDPKIMALKGQINLGELGLEGYSVSDGMVRLVLPRISPVVTHVFNEIHGSVIGGHEGTQKTYQRLSREFYWVGMRQDVAKMVAEYLTMDFIDGLPKSSGFSCDSYGGRPVEQVSSLCSLETSVHRNIEMFKYQGTTLKRSTTYHPQTDGQKEAEYWYNTSYHSTIRTTPFKVLYGRDPPRLINYDCGTALTFEVDRYLRERDRTLEELKSQFLRAQQIMKAHANGKTRDVSLEVGDRVYLNLRPYRQTSVAQRANQKLAPRFYGPYEAVERIGQVAYKLKLPSDSAFILFSMCRS